MAARPARVALIAAAVVVVLGAVALGVRALWPAARARLASDSCTVGGYVIDPAQASVAADMVGAVTQYRTRLPTRASVLVLAAALQESKLTNIPPGEGDRDSVGVLQQRPSQGWGGGKAAVLTDVGEATKEFLDALVKVPGWQTMPLANAVQAVQISADGSAYAQHEPEATALSSALRGVPAADVTCSFDAPTLIARPGTVARQAADQLGIDTPRASGRTVRVPGAGWQTAAWFVANSDRLGIETVDFSGRRWSRSDGWARADTSAQVVVATMYTKRTS